MAGEIPKCAPNTCCATGMTAEEKAAVRVGMSKVTCTQELNYALPYGTSGAYYAAKHTVTGEGSTESQAREKLESDFARFKATFWCGYTIVSFGLFECNPDIQRGQVKCQ